MSDEKLNFLDAEEPAAPAPEQSAPVIEADKPAAPEPEPQGDARARDPETGRFVPISALLDERDKRQAETRKREELEQQLQRYQQPQQPEQAPTDPSGIIQYALAEQQRIAFNERLNTSELMARQSHGEETVSEAQQAFLSAVQQNPMLQQQLQGQIHPYDFVVKWHKQHKLMSEIGQDPEAWRKSEAEKIRQQVLAELQGQGVQPAQSSQSQPPPSVVGRPAAARAGTVPVGAGNAFDNLFKG
jgi:hypothetical protein